MKERIIQKWEKGFTRRELSTVEKLNQEIVHKTDGWTAKIVGSHEGGFIVLDPIDHKKRLLLFKDVHNWTVKEWSARAN